MGGREWREGRGLDPRLKLNKKLRRGVFHFSRGSGVRTRIHNGTFSEFTTEFSSDNPPIVTTLDT